MIVGGLPGSEYRSDTVEAKPPFHLFVFSDGAYEVEDTEGNMWSIDGFRTYLVDMVRRGDRDIDGLRDHLRTMSGKDILDDDLSLLVVNRM
jgi:sigma-B regulation protein RsbU (phosphoserine phosphatase)